MDSYGKLLEVEGEKVYVTRGIYDYFDKNNFLRLLKAYDEAKRNGAKLYVGLYGNDLMEKSGRVRKLKDKVTDRDRVSLVEAIDLVDGAFVIKNFDKDDIISALSYRVLQKRNENEVNSEKPVKKYEIGYASGAFSNLHKGHVEHLKEMKKQCKTTIVAANSDNLIQNYKHKISSVDEETRRLILSHIKYVDMAIITDEYDKLKALDVVKGLCGKHFNAIFVGSDWKGDPKWKDFEQSLKKMGIDVVFTDRPQNGISTTAIDKSKRQVNIQGNLSHGNR